MKISKHWVLLTVAILAAFLLAGCGKDPPDETIPYGDVHITPSLPEEETEQNILLPDFNSKTGTGLPEEEVSDRTVLDGYEWYGVPSMGISINIPTGSTVSEKNGYDLVLTINDTDYYLHKFFNSSFKQPADIAGSARQIIKGTSFRYKGKDYSPTIFDTLAKNTGLTDKGFDIAYEKPYIIITETNGVRAAEPEMAVCYYLYQNDAYMLYALSDHLSYEDLLREETTVMSSVRAYVPAAADEALSFGKRLTVGNGISISVPDTWRAGTTSGMMAVRAPETSIYSGTEILIYVDTDYKYCEDYLSLGAGFSEKYVNYKCENGTALYNAENTDIKAFAEHNRNGIRIYYFDITDTVHPNVITGQLLPEGNVFYSYRYVFEDADEKPCIVQVSYTKDKEYLIYELAEKIAGTIRYIAETENTEGIKR